MAKYFMGIDLGTGGCRVGIFDEAGTPQAFHETKVTSLFPHQSWVEQDPHEWWEALAASVHKAVEKAGISPSQIEAIGYDATSATLVAIDDQREIVRPAIMWADVRAAEQARRASQIDHWARLYNAEGKDPASAEWFIYKALWMKENEPDLWARTMWVLDAPDWLGLMLTGRGAVNLTSASLKMHHNNDHGGFPTDFYEALGLDDLMEKMPAELLHMGDLLGHLSPEAAQALGLPEGIPVAEGGIDAEAGMIGMGVLNPGQMALITGSSNCLLAQSDIPMYGPGLFGAHTDALVPGQYTLEASQVSTGSIIRWFIENSCADLVQAHKEGGPSPYEVLNELAKDIGPGSEGVIVTDYFQGNRSPYTDPYARGTITGLTLHHRREHIYHAIQEATCFGLEMNLATMRSLGYSPRSIIACGGALNSPQWLQMHADITGISITVTKVQDGPTLGSAMMAAVACGHFADLHDAAASMVHEERVISPDPERSAEYRFWVEKYAALYPALADVHHSTAEHAKIQ